MHTRSPTPNFLRAFSRSAKRISSRTGLPVTMYSLPRGRYRLASSTEISTLSAVRASTLVVTPGKAFDSWVTVFTPSLAPSRRIGPLT